LINPSHYAQSFWENNASYPQSFTNGTVSIGVSPGPVNSKLRIQADGNTSFGAIIYNTSAITSPGSKYGMLLQLNDNSPNVPNYGIYSETHYQGTNSWAGYFLGHGYFSGNLGIGIGGIIQPNTERLSVWDGNFVVGSSHNKFVFHQQWWNPTSDFLSIAPWNNTLNNWDFSNSITLRNSGLVQMKNVDVADTLKVYEKIWAKSVEVKLPPFPDYVFASEYVLMPIDSLSAYVKKNGHLPNFPSASEMDEKNGFRIETLLIKQMEKIEELTLYIIQLHNETEKLKCSHQSNINKKD
jgi:hypothetical protein